MHDKFSRRIEEALGRLAARIARAKRRLDPATVNRQIGRILQRNQRAAARFAAALEPDACPAGFRLRVVINAAFDDWAALSEGAYLLRSNITDWSNDSCGLADQVFVFGARPGSIREVVDIHLPRPRPLSLKRSSRFLELEDRIWATIEREARRTMKEGMDSTV